MLRVTIINGPNLNLLGTREPGIYGHETFEDILNRLRREFPRMELRYEQNNVEGELVSIIQKYGQDSDWIVLNAAAYTHTSVAIADAVAAVQARVIGVHISNIYRREEERHIDLLAKYCDACLFGFGVDGYRLALDHVMSFAEVDVE